MSEQHDDPVGPIGVTTQHLSSEDGPIVGWSHNLGGGRIVWCGGLPRASFAELEREHQEAMHNAFGWFLVIYEREGRTVLGKAVDEYRARELVDLIATGLRSGIEIEP